MMNENDVIENEEQEEQQDTKPQKKKSNKVVAIVVVALAVGVLGFTVYTMLPKKQDERAPVVTKQIQQGNKAQVKALKAEEKQLAKVGDVKQEQLGVIGGDGESIRQGVWEELDKEAKNADMERGRNYETEEHGAAQKTNDEITTELKMQEGGESGGRRMYNSAGKDEREAEKEEYKLERTSMFAYSRTYQNAAYVEKDGGSSSGGTPSKAVVIDGATGKVEASEEDVPEKKVLYNSNPTFMLGAGDILDAVVTHKIVSDSKGSPVVCNISKDLLDDTGEWVLIPSGSRVIGKAGSVGDMGASRLFIYFEEIILPSGVKISLPPVYTVGLDSEGSLGVASNVDRHFLMKFGTAFLVGLLDGLGGFAQNQVGGNTGTGYFIDQSSKNFKEVNKDIMSQYGNVPPTITVRQGHRIKIYFPKTIEISGYEKAANRAYGRAE